ncbi:MAG: hypothetical protein HDQ96_08370 [Lachnospiraceae bacterium]|nr:hypothetical protein [Lachnospiraceae bacterium]
MAVGKGSMERAAKTAEKAKTSVKKAPASGATSAKKTTKAKSVTAAETIAAPTGEVLQKIVYQTSNGMLERAAEPNERFGLGDAMPVYYF